MSIVVAHSGQVATITLNRPEVRNTLDSSTISALHEAFGQLAADDSVRAVVLTGAGDDFCAGGDLGWMHAGLEWSYEENLVDAEALAAMFESAWTLPKPLVGRVNGPAIGSGAGLVACCDIALASDTAQLGFAEVKLGLLPAVVAPYVVPKIGLSHARALFVSGERITAERAFEIGLIHGVTAPDELDALVAGIVRRMLSSAPAAVAATKRLIEAIWTLEREDGRRYVIEALAQARSGAEGQEGVRAFLEKRPPHW